MTLRLETAIPYGNACEVHLEEAAPVPEVHFAADPHGGPECLWFCFRLVADGPVRGDAVRMVLEHPANMLGGNVAEHMRPVVRQDGGDWDRIGPGTAEPLPDGRWVVSWQVAAPKRWLEAAYCYPYGMPEVRALVEETGGAWRADTIGVSQGARPMVRLSNAPGRPEGDRPGLYLTARQHSGETPGSWVLDGLLRRLAQAGDRAPLVWAVPLTNVDGVEGGDYGKDNFPWDLNRAWDHPPEGQPMRHEVLVMQRDIKRWRLRCRAALGIDFHAPGGCEVEGVYFYVPDPDREASEHARGVEWAETLARAIGPDYAAENAVRVARYPSRWTTPSFRHFLESIDVCGLCQETPYAVARDTVLTREGYREIGFRLADGLVEALGG